MPKFPTRSTCPSAQTFVYFLKVLNHDTNRSHALAHLQGGGEVVCVVVLGAVDHATAMRKIVFNTTFDGTPSSKLTPTRTPNERPKTRTDRSKGRIHLEHGEPGRREHPKGHGCQPRRPQGTVRVPHDADGGQGNGPCRPRPDPHRPLHLARRVRPPPGLADRPHQPQAPGPRPPKKTHTSQSLVCKSEAGCPQARGRGHVCHPRGLLGHGRSGALTTDRRKNAVAPLGIHEFAVEPAPAHGGEAFCSRTTQGHQHSSGASCPPGGDESARGVVGPSRRRRKRSWCRIRGDPIRFCPLPPLHSSAVRRDRRFPSN